MELRQLRHLAALADFQNYQRAADAIGLSQSALSRSIQSLERDLDCLLVDRQSRDFRLTGQGELVLQHARRLLAGTRSLRNELQQYNGLDAGELRFGCGPYPAQLLVPEAMADFIRAHPAVHVGFLMGDWEQMAQLLKEEQVEFFVGDAREFAGDPDYQVRWMEFRPGRFFCRSGHPLAAAEHLQLADLLDYPRVGTRIPPPLRKVLAEVIGERDFHMNIECAQFAAILHIVARSDAVGLAAVEALHAPVQRGEVALLQIADIPQDRTELRLHYGIVSRAGFGLSPAAQAMIEAIFAADERLPRVLGRAIAP
ncbi:LysR family transcriptional regulator [Pseudomonas sp. GD04087]|uniref:LysR family transcriptional regulator n=1 Tax=unclassified Pseudomonas TaxID=196821 RepID=UPI002447BA21|nr:MULTISPECIES: LysR family transcriptional regulator [unclassified Pseudomonas]MDH0288503.1 LysR family transcriptional regulator [Pseudomonas sp. GD04087]MDH1051697.1 LysR family transcriptional regulator [Pseudomonas sp. GD03903]MDH2002479.1 LysR family transcriptional regulator [Pseudomonas sp. GD03691]